MGSSRSFLSNRPVLAVALVAVVGVILLWLGLFRGKTGPATTDAAKTEAAAPENKADGAYSDADAKLQELMRRQQMLSQQAGGNAVMQNGEGAANGQTGTGAAPGNAPSPATQNQVTDKLIAAREEAINEITHAGSDTKKIIAAMDKLDKQIRAAGVPSVIDMEKFRKMMMGAERLQEINKQLTEETQKGQQADNAKMQRLLKEISEIQASIPKTPYNMDELDKVMKSGH